MKKLTIKEAAEKWIGEWNDIPTRAVEIILNHDIDEGLDSYEITEEREYEYGYPVAYGTMWTFGSSLDEDWALENADILNECGIVAFYTETLGVVFGIDGAGYDFIDRHFIPLYKARGLQWHNVEDEQEQEVVTVE